ncbi:MAG: ABC transporter permease [Anaerolineales bacterium]
MSLKRIWAMTRKEIWHILRDRSTLILVLFTPTALLMIMAYALTVDLTNVPIAVLDFDRSQTSRAFVAQITAGKDLALYAQVGSYDELEALLMRGEIKAALVIGPQFAEDLLALKGMPIQILIDGTEPESGGFAVEHIMARAEAFVDESMSQQLQAMGLSGASLNPIDLRVRTWYNPDLKTRNDIIPGLLSMIMGFPALSVALTLAHEREHGTLEQIMATPIARAEFLLGKIIPYVFVGLFNVVFLTALARAWFHIPFNGSFPLFFGLSALFLFAILGMGMLIGVFMKTQPAALALSFLLIFFPGFFMTGIFFPLVAMPEEVRLESLFMPGTPYAAITRGIFLPANGLDVLWPQAVMLVFLGVSFLLVGALFFRKKLG